MNNYIKRIACLIMLPAIVFAAPQPNEELNQDMIGMAKLLQDLSLAANDDAAMQDPERRFQIKKDVEKLIDLFNQVESHANKRPVTFEISYDVLRKRLIETKNALEDDRVMVSKYLLRDLPSVCISCHQQDNQFRKFLADYDLTKFQSPFAVAEFYYLTRDYQNALEQYKAYLLSKPPKSEHQNVHIALGKQMLIYLRLQRDTEGAEKLLKQYHEQIKEPGYIVYEIEQWLHGMENVKKTFQEPDRARTFDELALLINDYFKRAESVPSSFVVMKSDQMFYLMLSGYLYDYLYDKPKQDEIPKVLYWLALCDRSLDDNYNAPLADLYLKECITGHPKHQFAKVCYKEYHDYITLSYSGSSGTHVPRYLEEELQELKKLTIN